MELLKVEHALCMAVEQQRDFSHSSASLGAIFRNLSLPEEKYDQLINEMVDFLNNYSPK